MDPARSSIFRGRLVDLGLFAANCWLVPRLTALAEREGDTNLLYAFLLLWSLFLYAWGAGLKRRPLARRLAAAPRVPTWAWIVLMVLLVMQLALGALSVMLPLEALGHRYPALARAGESPWMMFPLLLAGGLPVFATIRALVPPRPRGAPASARPEREWLGDLALTYAAVISLSIWDGMVMSSLAGRGPEGWAMGLLLTALLSVPFSMFYAAPRILFLVEDYRSPQTWLRMAAVMLPSVARLWQ